MRVYVQSAEEKSAIETAIDAAKETCESGTAGACATAWDEVRILLFPGKSMYWPCTLC